MSGLRNEEARALRRQVIKEQLSLTSVPKSDNSFETGVARQRLTLDNHFGWAVLNKTQVGDGTFPHLTQYFEKPDISGKEFEKVTYVLYMDKGVVVDKETAMKETQTSINGTLVRELKRETSSPILPLPPKIIPLPSETSSPILSLQPEEHVKKTEPKKREKKRKLIQEFYYIPRDRSRSPRRDVLKGNKPFHGDFEDNEYQEMPPVHPAKSQMSEIQRVVRFDDIMKEIETEKEDALKRINMEAERKKEEVRDKVNTEFEKEKEDVLKGMKIEAERKKEEVEDKVEKRKRKSVDSWNFRVDRSEVEHAVDFEKLKKNVTKEIDKEKEDAEKRMKMAAERKKEEATDKLNKETEKRKRKAMDGWKLRAGAENTTNKSKNNIRKVEEKASGLTKASAPKLIENLKYDPVKYGRGGKASEHLMESRSGTNKYLYLNKTGKSGKPTKTK